MASLRRLRVSWALRHALDRLNLPLQAQQVYCLLTGNFSSLSHRCDLFPLEFQILEEIFIRLEACA